MLAIDAEDAVGAYERELTQLLADCQAQQALDVFVARDQAARAIAHDGTSSSTVLLRLTDLDQSLDKSARCIAAKIGGATLADWRRARQPPADAWWWFLDQRAEAMKPPPNAIWALLSALCIAVSLGLIAEITRRFLSAGPDFVGILSTIFQALLALLAGTAFSETGRRAIERVFARIGVPDPQQAGLKAAVALGVLVIIIACRLALPLVAQRYNDDGARLLQAGQLTSASDALQRAVNLDPDSALAHYNLAVVFERGLEYDKAFSEYRRALAVDPGSRLAANNLAHLYLQQRRDWSSALELLTPALEPFGAPVSEADKQIAYSLHKNRAWAYLGLALLDLARSDTGAALQVRPDGAAAHCLFAQIEEATRANDAAGREWAACLAFRRGDDVEPMWIGQALQRTAGIGP